MSDPAPATRDTDADDSLATRPHHRFRHVVSVDAIVAAHQELADAVRLGGHVELPVASHGEPVVVASVAPADEASACPCSTWSRSPAAAGIAKDGNGHHPACHRFRPAIQTSGPDPIAGAARKELAVRIKAWAHEVIEHGQVLERLAAAMLSEVDPTGLTEARRIAGYRGEWLSDVGRDLLSLAAGDEWSK